MPVYKLQLFEDRLEAKNTSPLVLFKQNRILYVRDGMLHINTNNPNTTATLSHNSAWFGGEKIALKAGSNGANILRFELSEKTKNEQCFQTQNVSSRLLQETSIKLEPGEDYLLRCDRVDLPPGGIAFTHTHKGPGIRYLLNGGFTVETKGKKTIICPGQSWFESGSEPVLAYAPDDKPGQFCRVMILPRNLLGKSSIRYVKPEDKEKPKLQRYTIFIDEQITI